MTPRTLPIIILSCAGYACTVVSLPDPAPGAGGGTVAVYTLVCESTDWCEQMPDTGVYWQSCTEQGYAVVGTCGFATVGCCTLADGATGDTHKTCWRVSDFSQACEMNRGSWTGE